MLALLWNRARHTPALWPTQVSSKRRSVVGAELFSARNRSLGALTHRRRKNARWRHASARLRGVISDLIPFGHNRAGAGTPRRRMDPGVRWRSRSLRSPVAAVCAHERAWSHYRYWRSEKRTSSRSIDRAPQCPHFGHWRGLMNRPTPGRGRPPTRLWWKGCCRAHPGRSAPRLPTGSVAIRRRIAARMTRVASTAGFTSARTPLTWSSKTLRPAARAGARRWSCPVRAVRGCCRPNSARALERQSRSCGLRQR